MANTLLDLFEKNHQLLEWRDKVTLLSRQLVMGFSGSSKAVVMASALSEQVPKILIVTSTQNEAEQLTGDLSAILGEDKVYSFFADDVVAAEFIFASPEKTHSRLESLNFLIDKESSGILVTSLVGTKLHLPNPEVYKDSRIDLTLGEEHDLEALSKHLTHIGYQRVEQVLSPGEFSRRGDILDIYELTAELPYRLEFFGDEIDGIRQFDSDSQKSLDNLEHIIVSPADDIILTREDYQRAEKALESAVSKAEGPHKAYLEEVLSVTIDGHRHKDLRKFLSLFYDKAYTLFDYLPKGTPVFIDDFQKIVDRHGRLELEVANLLTEDLHQGKSLSHLNYFVDSFKTLRNYQPASFFSNFHNGLGNLKFDKLYQFTQYPMQEFFNQFPLLIDEIRRYTKNKATVILQVGSDKDQYLYGDLDWYDAFQGITAVIHYTTHNKPWTSKRFNRFREQWWFYYALSWEEILLRKPILKQTYQELVGEFPYHAAIYTHTADIHELETLLKELPDVAIHVLAHSHFGFNLVQLERYPILFLYPSFDPLTSRKVLEKLDFYLDINPYDEVDQMRQKIHQLGLPIFSFEGTNHVENGENQVFRDDQVQEMVTAIHDYLKRNEKKYGSK